MQKCIECKKTRADKEFQRQYKDGMLLIYNKCKRCRTKYIMSRHPNSLKNWKGLEHKKKIAVIYRKKEQVKRLNFELKKLRRSIKK